MGVLWERSGLYPSHLHLYRIDMKPFKQREYINASPISRSLRADSQPLLKDVDAYKLPEDIQGSPQQSIDHVLFLLPW